MILTINILIGKKFDKYNSLNLFHKYFFHFKEKKKISQPFCPLITPKYH